MFDNFVITLIYGFFSQGLRHNKMEKADILELTVKHLRQLQKQRFNGMYKHDT